MKKVFDKINKFSSKYNKISTIILSLFLLITLFMAFFNLSEYWHVGILKQTEGYPWGWRGAENYANPKVYAQSAIEGFVFNLLTIIVLVPFIIKKKSFYAVVLLALFILYGSLI
jgi:hypothetical protein